MKIIVDVGVGIAVETLLKDSGHDVVAVRDLDPSMPDEEILSRASSENRLVITMDKDFGELVYRDDRRHSGVLLLRMDDSSGRRKAEIVANIFEEHGTSLPKRFAVYAGGYIRIREESPVQQNDETDVE